MPKRQRGLFACSGATIRVADLVGKARMIDIMLTARVYKQEEAFQVGLYQYLIDGSSDDKAEAIACTAAENPALSKFAICSAMSHMQNMSAMDAAYAESVMAGIVNTQPASNERLEAFANKTAPRVRPD